MQASLVSRDVELPRRSTAQNGYLFLFDLSGYTAFLMGSKLEDASGILQSLLGTLLNHIEQPLEVVEIEGDAVFAYAPEASFRHGQTLLEVVERLYCTFAAAREQMERNAACDCSGCKQFPRLDLKVVIHHGPFTLSRLSPQQPPKPVGPAVVVAHRLLKNSVRESTGVVSYAFITQACVESLSLDWLEPHAITHAETYEHVGEVHGHVYDLAPCWEADRANRLVSVEAEDAWIEVTTDVAASTQSVWDVISAPRFKQLWRHADQIDVPEGRQGPGTEYRCYRGEAVSIDRVVDWQPFRRLTLDCEWPWRARLRMTTELSPTATGTRIVTRLSAPTAASRAHSAFVRAVYGLQSWQIERRCRAALDTIKAQFDSPAIATS
jgi:uncharacterized protein YndB with AHSA1/START domain